MGLKEDLGRNIKSEITSARERVGRLETYLSALDNLDLSNAIYDVRMYSAGDVNQDNEVSCVCHGVSLERAVKETKEQFRMKYHSPSEVCCHVNLIIPDGYGNVAKGFRIPIPMKYWAGFFGEDLFTR